MLSTKEREDIEFGARQIKREAAATVELAKESFVRAFNGVFGDEELTEVFDIIEAVFAEDSALPAKNEAVQITNFMPNKFAKDLN